MGGKVMQQCEHSTAMSLQRVDSSHQQVEQLVARAAVGGRFAQRRLVRQPAEPLENHRTVREALTCAR